MRRTKKNRQAEAKLFHKMEWEGGFYEAMVAYGLNPADYDLDKATLKEMLDLQKILEGVEARAEVLVERFEESAEELCTEYGTLRDE